MVFQKINGAFWLLLIIGSLAIILNTAMAQGEVCATGLVMDWFCIDRGTLLDPANTPTLINPVIHMVHCLVDVDQCVNSGFAILTDPSAAGKNYMIGYNVMTASNAMMLALMKTEGQCSTCNGTGTISSSFRIGVCGSVVDDQADLPVVEIMELMAVSASSDYCKATPAGSMPAGSPPAGSPPAGSPPTASPPTASPPTKTSAAKSTSKETSLFLFSLEWFWSRMLFSMHCTCVDICKVFNCKCK